MMPSNTIGSLQAPAAARSTGAAEGGPQFGQDQFLTLMLAQLRNQDPMKPLEPQEFIGQLAQFSTVTGIQGMQSSLEDLSGSMRSSQVLEGASLVGRSVLSTGGDARLGAGGTVPGAVEVPAGATSVEVNVRDASGALVRRFQLPPDEGLRDFSWDGRSDAGAAAPAGSYRLEAIARFGGRAESAPLLLQRRVDSVSIDPAGGAMTLNTNAGSLALGDVRRVM